METDIKDPIMPTSGNSSDEHEKLMCESDASDVSVTEHTTPLPAGEGPGVGLFCYFLAALFLGAGGLFTMSMHCS